VPRAQWNDEEDAALQGLPHLAQLLYLRCLRRHMDYRTGVVGQVRRVSYQMFKEVLEVERKRGSKINELPLTRKQLRVALDQLEAADLVIKMAKPYQTSPVLLLLPLANCDADFEKNSENGNGALIRPNEEGPGKGQARRAKGRAKEEPAVTPLYVNDSAPQPEAGRAKGRAGEGPKRKGLPPVLPLLDRQLDPDAVPELGEALQILIEGGVYPRIAMSGDHRLKLVDLLSIGATRAMLAEACVRAARAKRGSPFSVFYLEPIISKLLNPNPTNGNRGGKHGKTKLSARERAANSLGGDRVRDEPTSKDNG